MTPTPQPPATPVNTLVTGTVVDALTDQPVTGVTIRAMGLDEVMTGANGGFTLTYPGQTAFDLRATVFFVTDNRRSVAGCPVSLVRLDSSISHPEVLRPHGLRRDVPKSQRPAAPMDIGADAGRRAAGAGLHGAPRRLVSCDIQRDERRRGAVDR